MATVLAASLADLDARVGRRLTSHRSIRAIHRWMW
jgi:hypothetical protein